MGPRLVTLIAACLTATAFPAPKGEKSSPAGVWTYWIQGEKKAAACLFVPKPFAEMEKHLSAKHKKKCTLKEESDSFFFDCQGIAEVLFFNREECLLLEKKPLDAKQKRKLISFKSCFGPYRKLTSIPEAAVYCDCVGEKMATRYDDKKLQSMKEEQVKEAFAAVSKECLR